MDAGKVRMAFRVAALAFVMSLIVPASAMASGFFVERGILGLDFAPPVYATPVISGDNIIFATRTTAPGSLWELRRFNIVSGNTTVFRSDAAADVLYPSISGDWVVWQQNDDVRAKNIKSGVVKNVTNDGVTTIEVFPAVNGTLEVWWSYDGSTWNVKGKDLATTASPFTVAGGANNQRSPSIYGKRVAYLDDSNGHDNVYVKTIGSSAAPKKITDNAFDQSSPSIGDHLVAWRVQNPAGKWMIRYFDYNTGETHDGPTSDTYNMENPRVSGDRILYSVSNGSTLDLNLWDARVASVPGNWPFVGLVSSGADDSMGMIAGNEVVYMSGNYPSWGRLAVPSISLKSVPARIARGGHVHLAGSISDQGHRIGGASIGIEKYGSGAWTRVKTLTASSTGTFSYQTPKIYAKTQYRVVYDGRMILFGAGALDHFSTVSGTKTAWPR